MHIVIVGGGWAGCAASLSARKQGAEVTLVERTDMLLGTGLVGGIMRNNGRYTATEEMIAMGGGEIFRLIDGNCLHHDIEFPGHRHASLYNVATMEPLVRRLLEDHGVGLRLSSRVDDVERDGVRLKAVLGKQDGDEARLTGDAFVDATGTAGPPLHCNKYGNGCVMCVLRCPAFGGRVSITAKMGVQEIIGRRGQQVGAMSGSCKLLKESLSSDLNAQLSTQGVAVIPLPESLRLKGKLEESISSRTSPRRRIS